MELDLSPLIDRNNIAVVFNCRRDIEDFISAAKEQLSLENWNWDEEQIDYMLADPEVLKDKLAISVSSYEHRHGLGWCEERWYHRHGFEVINVDTFRTVSPVFEETEDISFLFM